MCGWLELYLFLHTRYFSVFFHLPSVTDIQYKLLQGTRFLSLSDVTFLEIIQNCLSLTLHMLILTFRLHLFSSCPGELTFLIKSQCILIMFTVKADMAKRIDRNFIALLNQEGGEQPSSPFFLLIQMFKYPVITVPTSHLYIALVPLHRG